jgi:formylmethanofuran dehydrogenase subunit E
LDFNTVAQFHGPVWPGLSIGYRVTLLAANYFKDRSKAEELVAIVENRSYAIDAIQVINSCTCEEKTLILKIFGECLHIFQIRR